MNNITSELKTVLKTPNRRALQKAASNFLTKHGDTLYCTGTASPAWPIVYGDPAEAGEVTEPLTPEDCAKWLDAKYARHHELEDKACSEMIRALTSALGEPSPPSAGWPIVWGHPPITEDGPQKPLTPEQCAKWCEGMFSRYHELEDRACAQMIRGLAAMFTAVQAPNQGSPDHFTYPDGTRFWLVENANIEYSPQTALDFGFSLFDANEKTVLFNRSTDNLPTPPAQALSPQWSLFDHLQRQREWSERTFGPGPRTEGVVDHIRKELLEIEAQPRDLEEWIDVVILALDGAWRAGSSPEQIIAALRSKQQKNEARSWPDWRTAEPGKAIEHDRAADLLSTKEHGNAGF
jgi:hypothetical protein